MPSLKDRLYYNADFSTVNKGVLMFTKHPKFVHKIYDFPRRRSFLSSGASFCTIPLAFLSGKYSGKGGCFAELAVLYCALAYRNITNRRAGYGTGKAIAYH